MFIAPYIASKSEAWELLVFSWYSTHPGNYYHLLLMGTTISISMYHR